MTTAPSTSARPDGRTAAVGLDRAIRLLTGAGLLIIVVVTFVTSFDAVSAVAADLNVVTPELAWAIPTAIDGLIVVGSAVLWSEAIRAGRWHPFPIAVVAAAGALSIAANVAHAGSDAVLAQVLAATPPTALLLAVELAAWQIRRRYDEPAAHHDGRTDTLADGRPVYSLDRFAATSAGDVVDQAGPTTPAGSDRLTTGRANGQRPAKRRTTAKTSGGGAKRRKRTPVDPDALWAQLERLHADDPADRSRRAVQDALGVSKHAVTVIADADPARFARLTSAGSSPPRVDEVADIQP